MKKKMSATNAKALNTMRQRLKKHSPVYAEQMMAFRANPESEPEPETESEAEVRRDAYISFYWFPVFCCAGVEWVEWEVRRNVPCHA